jgi:hypothetical protein
MTSGTAPAFEPPFASSVREAVRGDNDALLELTSSCPMEGDIGLCIDRSPDFFRLCTLGNTGFRVGVIRGPRGTLVGCATVADRRVWAQGRPVRMAWASDLKVDRRHRRTGAAAQLIHWVVDQSRSIVGEAGPLVSTVLSGNQEMERLFPGGPGRFRIQPFARLRAHAIPLFHRPAPEAKFRIDVASGTDHSELRELWNRYAPERQLAPLAPVGLGPLPPARGERFTDPCHLIARDGAGRIQAFLGIWDQRAVKQLRVTGFSVRLGAARAAINLLAPFIGAERLPGSGEILHSATVVDLCVPPDAPELLRALLLAANRVAMGSGLSFLTLGLDARDPLAAALRGMHAQPTDFSVCVSAASGEYGGPPLGDGLVHFEPALG